MVFKNPKPLPTAARARAEAPIVNHCTVLNSASWGGGGIETRKLAPMPLNGDMGRSGVRQLANLLEFTLVFKGNCPCA